MKQNVDRIEELEYLIAYHQDLYYNGTPEIDDETFDSLTNQLRKLNPESKALKAVGAKTSTLVWPTFVHQIAMGSQLKVSTSEEFEDWAARTEVTGFHWSEKLDGSSIAICYKNGQLFKGISRGDGVTGSDITQNVLLMNVPKEHSFPGTFWIRGEIIMKKSTFEEKYKNTTKNPRNAAAGIARRLDGVGCEDLGVIAYDVEGIDFPDEAAKFKWLEDNEFFVPGHGEAELDEIKFVYDGYVDRDRETCPFEIDGLVIRVNNIAKQKALGVVDNRPKGQRAFKFPSVQVETTLVGCVFQTGRTGRICPVGLVEPVDVGGVTISRVTLDNFDMVASLGLGIGSKVFIERRNDVIPKIGKALTVGKPILPPASCPSCGEPTSRDGAYLVCKFGDCPAQNIAHLLNFLRALDVKGIGEGCLEYLVETGKLKSILDFYALKPNDFESVKVGKKLCDELDRKISKMTLPVFIDAIGIPNIGQHATELVMTRYPTIERMLEIPDYQALIDIPGLGHTSANWFIDGLHKKQNLIRQLLERVEIITPEKVRATGSKMVGQVYIFTGFRSDELAKALEKEGAEVINSMSKRVTHVVAKEVTGSSSKLKKAREAGLTILSKNDLETLVT